MKIGSPSLNVKVIFPIFFLNIFTDVLLNLTSMIQVFKWLLSGGGANIGLCVNYF